MIHCNELKQMCNTVISSSRYNSKIQIIGINNELRMGEAWYDCPINTDKMTAQIPISQYSTISININILNCSYWIMMVYPTEPQTTVSFSTSSYWASLVHLFMNHWKSNRMELHTSYMYKTWKMSLFPIECLLDFLSFFTLCLSGIWFVAKACNIFGLKE